jgi:TrkA domain protein
VPEVAEPGLPVSQLTETQLPGVGVRHEFSTAEGERVAVVAHRSGRRELAVYERDDPDACRTVLHLDARDARLLVDVLGGATQVSEAVTAVQRLEGLAIDWMTITPGSAAVGTTIGEGAYRASTGVSIVGVVRAGTTIPSPGPDFAFEAGDVAVAVGTPDGLGRLRELLRA